MSPVSERVSDASPPEWGDRVVRSLALEALALLQAGQSGVSPRLDQRDAPSLAMSTRTAEERDSQPAQRDELAHSRTVPTAVQGCDGESAHLAVEHLTLTHCVVPRCRSH